jgi:hypothetical protein
MKIKQNPWVLLILFVGLLLSSIILTGCAKDPGFGIFGTIYEWKDAPPDAVSRVYTTIVYKYEDIDPVIKCMQEIILTSIQVAPLEDAKVEVWDTRDHVEYGFMVRWTASDLHGDFRSLSEGAVGHDPSVTVSKSGYMEATARLYPGMGYLYIIMAVLVRQR